MKLARYVGNGQVAVVEEAPPVCPDGGLLVKTSACGLCSGELMSWYMDKKIPHVIGHEVSGVIIESQDDRFPVGASVFPHHHAPCLKCNYCLSGRTVHCDQWRKSKLIPGGMAEIFAVPSENLNDTIIVDDIRPQDAALIEPLACVMKSLSLTKHGFQPAVIGLGVMGLLHMIVLGEGTIGYDINPSRIEWARSIGLDARPVEEAERHDEIYVCPGLQSTFDLAVSLAEPGASICMFAPLAPGEDLKIPQSVYFKDISIFNAYSCGPEDTKIAYEFIRTGQLSAEQVISNFISLDELPEHYIKMRSGEILKPMVMFT